MDSDLGYAMKRSIEGANVFGERAGVKIEWAPRVMVWYETVKDDV